MTNPIPELTPMLTQLRLSGISDSLAQRNREAIENQLSYTDFLSLLIGDEVARRDHKKYENRIRRAGFRGEKTLENFDFAFDPNIDQKLINTVAGGSYLQEKVAVLIVGPCGTGKSHIAQALGHCAVRQGVDVLFTTQNKMLSQLHAARATNTFERRFQTLVKMPLIVVDDFGLKPLKSPHDEDFHELIAERYERSATIISSNLDYAEWGDAFPNKLLGAATIDRLLHGAYRIILDGPSYRTPKPLKNTAKKEAK